MKIEPNKELAEKLFTIEVEKVFAETYMSPQVAHDLKANIIDDDRSFASRELQRCILRLTSYLYRTEKFEQIKEVPFYKKINVTVPSKFYIIQLLSFIGITFFLQLNFWYFIIAALICLAPAWYLCTIGFKTEVEGTAKLKKVEWDEFPHNSMIYPEQLGKPYRRVIKSLVVEDES